MKPDELIKALSEIRKILDNMLVVAGEMKSEAEAIKKECGINQ